MKICSVAYRHVEMDGEWEDQKSNMTGKNETMQKGNSTCNQKEKSVQIAFRGNRMQ